MTKSSRAATSTYLEPFWILAVDDDPQILNLLTTSLGGADRRVITATDGFSAMELLRNRGVDLVFLDIKMPGADGIEVLKDIKTHHANVSVVVMTGYGTVEHAIEAIKNGASDFIIKPLKLPIVKDLVDQMRERKGPSELLKHGAAEPFGSHDHFLACDDRMSRIIEDVKKIAPLPTTVLIEGESGTGKELLAKAIHAESPRSRNRFIAFNCGAIPPNLLESELFGHEKGAFTGAESRKLGYFEVAAGGTVFLDEIAEMSLELQAKLLRVMQERAFRRVGGVEEISTDVRIIAATNRSLQAESAAGRFRKDLYYRVNVVKISVPPLRERPNDITLLTQYFVDKYAAQFDKEILNVNPAVIECFLRYRWGGNVRELQNVVERAVAYAEGNEIRLCDLPEEIISGEHILHPPRGLEPFAEELYRFEDDYLVRAITSAGGNIARASRLCGLSRQNLYQKLDKHGIDLARFRDGDGDEVA